MTEELHVILGATGATGSLIVKELKSRGLKVRGINRSGIGPENEIEYVGVDIRNDPEGLKKAVAGASVVYHSVGLPDYTYWMKNFPNITENIIEAVTANGPDTKLVYIDNLYCFGKEEAEKGPLREDTPHRPSGKKGNLRSSINRQLLDAHKRGKCKVAIGHASDFYGPGSKSSILDIFVFNNIVKNKKIKMLADKSKKHSFAYQEDVARALVDLALSEKSWGDVWMLPHTKATSLQDFIDKAYQASGKEAKNIGSLPSFAPRVFGLISKILPLKPLKILGEVDEVKYQFLIDFTVDSTKFEDEFGWKATSLEDGLKITMDWYLKNGKE